jgi:hypothetical protein
MAEVVVKSPQLHDRELSTYQTTALVTLDGATDSTIDIPGLTVVGTATGFVLSGFEAAADVALDSDRGAGITFMALGVVATAEESDIWIKDAVISGTAGSRVVTVDVNIAAAAALNLTTDSITGAQVAICLPIKAKDF